MIQTDTCDRCTAKIPDDIPQPRPFFVSIAVGDSDDWREYEEEARVLCSACEQDLLKWIDGDYTRENAVDLPPAYSTGETFRRFATQLEDMADEIQDM